MNVLNRDKILEAAKQWADQGKFDRAIREYEKLLVADPKDMRVKLRIAELFVKRKQIPEAIKVFREVAESYSKDGFYLKAVTVYKNILRLNPALVDVNQGLAHLYEKMGLHQDAVYQYEILANSFEQKSQFAEALKVREKLVELAPEEAGHRIRLAEGLQREGEKDEALKQYEILAGQYKAHNVGEEKLLDLYERLLPNRPGNLEMLSSIVEIYYRRGDIKAALKWLEQNAKWIEDQPELIEKQAMMYGQLNQLETARSRYQALAELYAERGETAKALDAFCEILVLLPEETETIREHVEAVSPGQMDVLIREALQKRQKRQQEQQIVEEKKQKEIEARETAKKEAAKKPKAEKMETKPVATPPTPVTTAPRTAKPSAPEDQLSLWLQEMRAALELARAYMQAGLEVEASQEQLHAQGLIEEILASHPDCEEAKREKQKLETQAGEEISQETSFFQLKDLDKLEEKPKPKPEPKPVKPAPAPTTGKKKISFV